MGSLLTSLLFHILRGMHVALVIYAPSLVINMVTGLPVWECILFMGCFTTFYTALGGMRAVIWTDVIQFCAVSVGVLLIFYTALHHVSGGAAAAYRTALEAGRLRLFNFSTDPRELTSFWACIIGGSILCAAVHHKIGGGLPAVCHIAIDPRGSYHVALVADRDRSVCLLPR